MSLNSWILRFGELGLKSKSVRKSFQRSLRKNMLEMARSYNLDWNEHVKIKNYYLLKVKYERRCDVKT